MEMSPEALAEATQLTMTRLQPDLDRWLAAVDDADRFRRRFTTHFPRLFDCLIRLYGSQYDFYYRVQQAVQLAIQAFAARSPALRAHDVSREANPDWFQSERMLGAVCYVDLFAGDLAAIEAQIPYFEELGITYLHLMPLFKVPEPRNDGGYAVSSFREVNPRLGTMQQLAHLAEKLRERGVSLCLDFVFNHTADEHEWARRAQAGNRHYERFYHIFPDRTLPDQYEPFLREIFPDQAPGSFTYRSDMHKWVWTTFYPFQWDLNYENPDVFLAMLGEMYFLANQGIEILRLDAVPFIWKRLGTDCENLPEAHFIIRAYNALMAMAAPAVLFLSEAIVHPRDVRSYIDRHECPLSYNPILMVAIWEAVATRDARLMTVTMQRQFALGPGCAWLNYLRSHDDIGWGFSDEDAQLVGIHGFDHRWFLNRFYTGQFPGSFARGLPFNYNPRNQDMRISGTLASLAGIEQAEALGSDLHLENAIRRVLLMHGIIMAIGGIPLLYLGDEVATTNDYRYAADPRKAEDSRWAHRPSRSEARYTQRTDPTTIPGRVYQGLLHLIAVRKRVPVLADQQTVFLNTSSSAIFAFTRHDAMLVLANVSDAPQRLDTASLPHGWQHRTATDALTGTSVHLDGTLTLDVYEQRWLIREEHGDAARK
jgi:glycosidase